MADVCSSNALRWRRAVLLNASMLRLFFPQNLTFPPGERGIFYTAAAHHFASHTHPRIHQRMKEKS